MKHPLCGSFPVLCPGSAQPRQKSPPSAASHRHMPLWGMRPPWLQLCLPLIPGFRSFLPLSSALAVKSLFCPPFLTIRTLSFGSLTYLQYNKYFCRAQSFIEYFDGFFQRACRRFCTSVLNIKKDAENIAFSCILANGGCQTSGRNSKRDRNFATSLPSAILSAAAPFHVQSIVLEIYF